MKETPRIVTRARRIDVVEPREFNFTEEMVNLNVSGETIRNYRKAAWEAFKSTRMPSTSDEAWRRTDLRGLKVDSFRLPVKDAFLDLPSAPERLLKPLADSMHGGEIILMAGGSHVRLDAELSRKGVVFTELNTALDQYPHLVEKILGKAIKPNAGKFAALAGSFAQTGVFLYVPKGVEVQSPLHSLLWGPGCKPGVCFPHHGLP